MQAITMNSHGDASVVTVSDLPEPTLQTGQAKVKLMGAALNHLDLFVRQGWPGLKLEFPHIMGSDGMGEIVDIAAPSSDNLKVGDQVVINPTMSCGSCEFCSSGQDNLCQGFHLIGEHINGTYCEYICVPTKNLVIKPHHLAVEEAAALPLTYVTAYRMLFSLAKLEANQNLLIQGIGGGVAMAMLSLAKSMGANVMVTSRQQDKIDQAIKLGASAGFHSNSSTLAKQVRQHTKGRGVDVVFDSVGKATWDQSLKCLRRGGKLVTCGATTGNPREDLRRIFWNQLQIFGSSMGNRQEFADMINHVNKHKLKPLVDRSFPLDKASEALTILEAGQQMGKLVLKIN